MVVPAEPIGAVENHQQQFGPWAMVTGASSGIGRSVANHLAANGINLVLAARLPYIANYAATKSYVLELGEAVHRELAPRGVHVTVLVPGATATAMTARFGADKTPMGRLMMSADACAAQGLAALAANRAVRISGRANRATVALTPRRVRIRMFGAMNRSMAERATSQAAPSAPGVELDDRPV